MGRDGHGDGSRRPRGWPGPVTGEAQVASP
jgi:hypothetical protein